MNRILRNNVIDVGAKSRPRSLILLVIFVPVLGLGVAGVVWANAVIALGTIVLLILQLRRVGAWGKPTFNGPMLRRATRFALPAYAGNVAAYLNYRADEFIIAAFLPAEQLGFYAVAVGLVERIWIVPGAVSTALLPSCQFRKTRSAVVVGDDRPTRHALGRRGVPLAFCACRCRSAGFVFLRI